jgi:predicted lipid-binding transport protein (Tim44 family)
MRRTGFLAAALLAACLVLAPGLALARAGGGGSFGSRGGMTHFSAPSTRTTPYGAAPIQRSLTPPAAPGYGAPGYGTPGYRAPLFGGRSSFMSGLFGGLIGAGIGGLLFGGGLFHGVSGFGGLLGLLIQIAIIVLVVRFVWRLMTRGTAMAGGGMLGGGGPGMGAMPMGGGFGMGGAAAPPAAQPVAIGPADYQAFEQLLQAVQAAWSAQDIRALQAVATPEMVSYFGEQLAEQSSRGVRNLISDVHLDQGDLAEAWAEAGREYATVAMKFSMVDVTMDAAGRVVDGDPRLRTQATEVWTFLRAPGGHWVLSAIQQAR